ncbi:uncharacterized protein LOC130426283 isoform X2 [Triplophysa dalaica]|uniref:uncharacterized protein LOC130426283 isoform X2 n=1 Tax=Triplophysa dalaica TaxID=1582913 RepID=UPI0024DF809D|nr:uncharacterized protein LOC130426283 isoform X2 [Triplophysa dalaica]
MPLKIAKYCAVPGCGRTQSLHNLPSDSDIRNAWLKFIFKDVPAHVAKTFSVCSLHFTADSFVNKAQVDAGFAERLRLKSCALPSILDPTGMAQQSYAPTKQDVACQTDTQKCTSQGTQLSCGTLGLNIRSKGTETGVWCKSIGVSTTSSGETFTPLAPLPWTSAPLKDSRPRKRARLELEGEECASFEVFDQQDTTAVTTATESSQRQCMSTREDSKYIVFENCLLQLFDTCPLCSRRCDVRARRKGTFVAVDQLCPHCHYFRQWKSQPVVGSTPLGNLQLSAAIYFTGGSFFQLEKIFNTMHVKTITHRTFRKHASMYLEPAIIYTWKKEQEELLQQLSQGDKVILGGDMRADSPGHSAKYGSYTVMDLKSNIILDIQLVQSNEVAGSYHMEKEGLKRSLEFLEAHGVRLECIVTDRHPQIQHLLRECKITQFYDVWHLEKGLSKKLEHIGRDKDCQVVKKWQRSIKNHVYWTAASSKTAEERVAKWTSMVNHIQDIHVHDDPAYPQCAHEIRASKDRRKWFQQGTKALNTVQKLLANRRILKDVKKLSPHFQTSSLQAFHSVILRFAPKTVVYPYHGMLCRLYLAGMHFNENSNRPGKPTYKPLFPKAKKGEYSTRAIKSQATYRYVKNLMTFLFEKVITDPLHMEDIHKIKVPETLTSI